MAYNLARFSTNFKRISKQSLNFCSKSDKLTKNNNKSQDNNKKSEDNNKKSTDQQNPFPEAPTNCCMSGCPNCVWVEYAEKLCEYFKDGGEKAIEEIEKKVTDPNMKAFLMHELRMRNIKKK
ncbi:unnamed protein product [Psylliodes chrysocephalus]|uniref:Oxidoreductase-like domain-containing protein n=1 Tax=Psylliodes chrysocephalus TaxID=3402493 RepID=A0A9P0GF70_9CUCU|nr:unnamed protein product [Psylliodes chrysocephala]